MPIEFSRSYKASDGKCYGTLEEAQEVEIRIALQSGGTFTGEEAAHASEVIVENKDAIVNILTLTDSSRPKARGKSKPRKHKTEPAQGELPKVA